MLAYLHVKNIALIEELEIEFEKGLNILTGETGAGKSILLGSINYVLGGKMKKDFIRTGASEAFVECVFDVSDEQFDKDSIELLFEQSGITEDENGIIISRKTSANGRSVFRINGEVVRQGVVKELSGLLIDIHSQHDQQSLLSSARQLDLLDRFAGEEMVKLLGVYDEKYKEYQSLMASINEELMDDDKRRREIAFLEFEINEIEEAALELDEDLVLQKDFERLSHSKEIQEELAKVDRGLYGGHDIGFILSSALGELSKFKEDDEELKGIVESMAQVEDILTMLKRDLRDYIDNQDDYREALYGIEERLNLINQLKLKYGDTVAAIYEYMASKQEEHGRLVDFEKNLLETKEAIGKVKEELKHYGGLISDLRKEKALHLKKLIENALWDLNLEHAAFEVGIEDVEEFTSKGMNKLKFLISTNKGEQVKPLKEVASGGELSRVMLALKSILAKVDGVDTLIFDEIDTGISGVTAQKVAEKMAGLSKDRQLICITHLPQIAAMSNMHFLIHKEVVKDSTLTFVDSLDNDGEVTELARMLSGAVTSDAVIASAKEMRSFGKNY